MTSTNFQEHDINVIETFDSKSTISHDDASYTRDANHFVTPDIYIGVTDPMQGAAVKDISPMSPERDCLGTISSKNSVITNVLALNIPGENARKANCFTQGADAKEESTEPFIEESGHESSKGVQRKFQFGVPISHASSNHRTGSSGTSAVPSSSASASQSTGATESSMHIYVQSYPNLRVHIVDPDNIIRKMKFSFVVLPKFPTLENVREALLQSPLATENYNIFFPGWTRTLYVTFKNEGDRIIHSISSNAHLAIVLKEERKHQGSIAIYLEECKNDKHSRFGQDQGGRSAERTPARAQVANASAAPNQRGKQRPQASKSQKNPKSPEAQTHTRGFTYFGAFYPDNSLFPGYENPVYYPSGPTYNYLIPVYGHQWQFQQSIPPYFNPSAIYGYHPAQLPYSSMQWHPHHQHVPHPYHQHVPHPYHQQVPHPYHQHVPHPYHQHVPHPYHQHVPHPYQQHMPHPSMYQSNTAPPHTDVSVYSSDVENFEWSVGRIEHPLTSS